jgi:alpha-L-fucosidase 2
MAGVRAKGETAVAAVVPFYAPHDLVMQVEHRHAIGEGMGGLLGISQEMSEANFKALHEASPIQHLHAGMPPYLQIHGDKDDKVPHEQSVIFQQKMKALGTVCELITIPGGSHGMGGWAKLSPAPDYAGQMIEWLRKTMR